MMCSGAGTAIGHQLFSLFLILSGGLLLLHNFGLFHWHLWRLWPLWLIFMGLLMLLPRQPRHCGPEPGDRHE